MTFGFTTSSQELHGRPRYQIWNKMQLLRTNFRKQWVDAVFSASLASNSRPFMLYYLLQILFQECFFYWNCIVLSIYLSIYYIYIRAPLEYEHFWVASWVLGLQRDSRGWRSFSLEFHTFLQEQRVCKLQRVTWRGCVFFPPISSPVNVDSSAINAPRRTAVGASAHPPVNSSYLSEGEQTHVAALNTLCSMKMRRLTGTSNKSFVYDTGHQSTDTKDWDHVWTCTHTHTDGR